MSAQRRENIDAAPVLRDVSIDKSKQRKAIPPLSARDKKIIECLLQGKTETATGEQFGITRQRVNEIKHLPGAIAYMAAWANAARSETYGMVIHIIRDRIKNAIQHGTDYVDWESLIKLVKVLEPKQEHDASAYEWLHGEAERIAEEMNLSPEGRAKVLALVRESA